MLFRPARIILILVVLTFCCITISEGQVNGEWSQWAVFSTPCSATCGGGTRIRMRSCTEPQPQTGGSNCTKTDNTTGIVEYSNITCNNQSCYDGVFTEWFDCAMCTIGVSVRHAVCEGNVTCNGTRYKEETKPCNNWFKESCPSPCAQNVCPPYGNCQDQSTEKEPKYVCNCIMGYQLNADGSACVRPPPLPPTPPPIPTMPPAQKVVATVISTTASTVLIIFVSICLLIFLAFRVFTPDRVIQMNMEIAIVCAHAFLMFPPTTYNTPTLCRIVSICTQFFFTACFAFMMLEALHMYSLVASVVKKDGMFTRLQNTLIGWGIALIIIAISISFELSNYGAPYHCWLRLDTPLVYSYFLPIILISIVTFTLIEAAGVDGYKPLKGVDHKQIFSARISHYTNLIILIFVMAHMTVGILSVYEQSLPLYSVFSILNGVTGALILFLHCSCNHEIRVKLKEWYRYMCLGESA